MDSVKSRIQVCPTVVVVVLNVSIHLISRDKLLIVTSGS